jgi:SNF family Na+-dependent transporter
MNKNPYLNAVLASVYIIIMATLLQNGHYIFGEQDNFLSPVLFLSLFVLSAALMGYLFIGEPVMLFLDNQKKQAVTFFWQTVSTFACITLLLVIAAVAFGQMV